MWVVLCQSSKKDGPVAARYRSIVCAALLRTPYAERVLRIASHRAAARTLLHLHLSRTRPLRRARAHTLFAGRKDITARASLPLSAQTRDVVFHIASCVHLRE